MDLKIDGAAMAQPRVFTNELSSHRAFVDDYVVVSDLPASEHTVRPEAFTTARTATPPTNISSPSALSPISAISSECRSWSCPPPARRRSRKEEASRT